MTPATCSQLAPGTTDTQTRTLGGITVIIPARNAEATISNTLRSLASERELLHEILLIDDGSDDATAQIARTIADRFALPLEIIRINARSVAVARNVGIVRASGEFLYFLDADDEVITGGLRRLYDRLTLDAFNGIAIGACIRRTEGRSDLLKMPGALNKNRQENANDYLTNKMWPIAMGSALLRRSAVADLLFPAALELDEDTCYWAAVLSRVSATTIPDPVMIYMLDELRMSDRFTRSPERTLLKISREFDNLQSYGVPRHVVQWRKAWVALRITRQLLMRRRYTEAQRTLRVVQSHPAYARSWRAFRYWVRIQLGKLRQKFSRTGTTAGLKPPAEGPQRTLVLTADPAVPPVSGAELRNWQNAVCASKIGPTTIASVRPIQQQSETDNSRMQIASLTDLGEPRCRSLARRRTRVDIRIPRSAAKRLIALMKQFRPDTVIVEGLPLFPLMKYLRPLCRQMILDMHNVESQLSAQMPHARKRWRLRNLFSDDAKQIRRLERKAIKMVDRLWVCSERDEDRVRRLFRVGLPVDVVPNGIPRFSVPDKLPPYPTKENGCCNILYVGHFGYLPNADAAHRLAHEIFPRVRKRLPNAKLILAGRSPSPAVQAMANIPGVVLIPNPDDIATELQRTHVTAIPLRWAGGTRLKILEAMAWGLPVVASCRAVEGLGLANDHDFLLAETDDDFADRIIQLVSDPDQIEALRLAAHSKAVRLYGLDSIEKAVRSGLGVSVAPQPLCRAA